MSLPARRRLALFGFAALTALAAAAPARPQSASDSAIVTSLTLFAGTAQGLHRSRDWGGTWERAFGRGLDEVGSVRAILPIGPRVYLGGDGGLYVSDDFGLNWTRSYSATPVLAVCASRYPQADPTVFIGTPAGLLKSGDAGRSFAPTAFPQVRVERIEWPGPDLVLATARGVLVSKDAGASFTGPGGGLPGAPVLSLALSSFYAVDPVLYAGVTSGAFRSSNAAETWAAAGLEGRSVNDLVWLGPSLYAATEVGLLRSEDLGKTWSAFGEGAAGRAAIRILFPLAPAAGAEVFLGTDRGVYWSGDGGQHWRASGLQTEAITALATFPQPDPVQKKRR